MRYTPITTVTTKSRFDIYSYGEFKYSTFDAKVAEVERLMDCEIKVVHVDAQLH